MVFQRVTGLVGKNRDFILNIFKSYFVTFANLLVLVFSTRYIIKEIGVERYGLWLLIQNVFSYVGVLHFGYVTSFVTFFGRKVVYEEDEGAKSRFLNTHIILLILLSVFIASLLLVVFFFPDLIISNIKYKVLLKNTLLLMMIGYVSVFFTQSFDAILFLNFKMFNNRLLNDFVSASGQSIVFCLVIFLRFNTLPHMAIVYSGVATLVAAKNIYLFNKKVSFRFSLKEFDFSLVKSSFVRSISFWAINVSSVFLNQVDYLFISKCLNLNQLIVVYSQTSRIPQVFYSFITKVTQNKSPKIIELYSKRQVVEIKSVLNNLMKITFLASVLGGVFFMLFGKFILNLWLGDLVHFDQLLIILFGLVLIPKSMQWVFWTYFNNVNEPRYNLYVALIEIAINVSLSFMLVEKYKLVGLVFSSLVGLVVSNIVLFYFYTKHQVE
jgi:O-antigen/teichoic acid export membrane protein